MSGNMKRLRRTNNPLDRNTRNDINYNWEVLDKTLSSIDTSDFKIEQQFSEVDSQIKELEQVDQQLSDRINKNRDDIDAMDLDLLIEQGKVAEQKGQVAKKQGDYAEEQGNIAEQKGKKAEEQGNTSAAKGIKAEQQGDYAKVQGLYANEKAEYAAETTSKIIEANEDLAKTKLDTVEATQKANTSADYAQQAGDKATEQAERVQPIIDKSEIAYKEIENATNKVNDIVDHVVKQSDYAKETADKINKDYINLKGLKEETIKATNYATEATDEANTSSKKANEQATRAKEKTDYLESLLPNIEGWEFKGDWQKDKEYEKHNIVTFNGSTYILFSDKAEGSPVDDVGWHMLARRGIDGQGAVQSVNGVAPDLKGNVDLGELATPADVKDAADKTLEAFKGYTDKQISEIPKVDLSPYATTKNTEEQITKAQTEVKEYTDKKIDGISEIDITHLETKEDATAKLEEAKQYTDEVMGDVDLSKMEKKIKDHSKEIATTDKTGHVQIGKGLDIDKSGILSTKTASKKAIESGVSDDEFITPKGLNESKEKIIKSVVDIKKYDEHLEEIASKNELGHFKVGKGLEIEKDGTLNVKNYLAVYGVEIDEDNSDPFGAVTYIEDAEGFEPLYTGDGNVDLGSWGDKFPINKVKIVLLKDGKVIEELDKNDHTKTVDGRTVDITSGNSGDVMVGIPLTYWKFERVGSKLRIYVSEHEIDKDYKAYAHSRNGIVQDDYLYIGAYKGNVQDDKLRSLHDVISTGSNTIGKFREYAENKGEGHLQQNWSAMTLMQIFAVLLTKSTDSQSALGRGYVDGNGVYIKNGGTTKKGLFYGESTGKEQMKFLGIEDFWGNRYEWVDGLATDPDRMWLINDKNTNYNSAGDGYTKHGECFDSNGYISQVDGKTNTGFIPVKTNGSSSTYYADYGFQSSSGSRAAYFSGYRSIGSKSGTFLLNVNVSPLSATTQQGARCLFLKKK